MVSPLDHRKRKERALTEGRWAFRCTCYDGLSFRETGVEDFVLRDDIVVERSRVGCSGAYGLDEDGRFVTGCCSRTCSLSAVKDASRGCVKGGSKVFHCEECFKIVVATVEVGEQGQMRARFLFLKKEDCECRIGKLEMRYGLPNK